MVNYLDIVSGVLAALYLVLHSVNSRWRAVWSFAIVTCLLVAVGQPTSLALLIGILISHLAQLPMGRSRAAQAEHFTNSEEEVVANPAAEEEGGRG